MAKPPFYRCNHCIMRSFFCQENTAFKSGFDTKQNHLLYKLAINRKIYITEFTGRPFFDTIEGREFPVFFVNGQPCNNGAYRIKAPACCFVNTLLICGESGFADAARMRDIF